MDPFKVAERYLQLKKLCAPRSVGDQMIQINEMILAPLISLTFLCLQSLDLVSALTSALSVYRAWSRWIEYSSLRFEMQRMYLQTMAYGGPQIVTNDPEYLPYVYADAVVRAGRRRQSSAPVLRRLGPWSHIQSSPPVPATPVP
jgi:hypothetical protein